MVEVFLLVFVFKDWGIPPKEAHFSEDKASVDSYFESLSHLWSDAAVQHVSVNCGSSWSCVTRPSATTRPTANLQLLLPFTGLSSRQLHAAKALSQSPQEMKQMGRFQGHIAYASAKMGTQEDPWLCLKTLHLMSPIIKALGTPSPLRVLHDNTHLVLWERQSSRIYLRQPDFQPIISFPVSCVWGGGGTCHGYVLVPMSVQSNTIAPTPVILTYPDAWREGGWWILLLPHNWWAVSEKNLKHSD